jgi:sugar phosphate isomerase/epimerase
MHRRDFLRTVTAAATLPVLAASGSAPPTPAFRLNYILASPLYGTTPLAEVISQVNRAGATAIDVWPRQHADHREQMDVLGHDRVRQLLDQSKIRLAAITRFDLGPYGLRDELKVLKEFGAELIVTGSGTGKGDSLREKVRSFVESMKPHVEAALAMNVTIAIENHANSLINTPDSIRWFAEFAPEHGLSIALAPYHLPQEPDLMASLITDLGPKLALFYAWQHGKGCMAPQPKADELLQLPGRGPFDFRPALASLRKIHYAGWTEIFMHPYPRGIPILETSEKVTDAVNESRSYLERILAVA